MKALLVLLLGVIDLFAGAAWAQTTPKAWLLEVHGGAGDIVRAGTTPEQERAYRATLTEATEAAGKVLDGGGSSVDAVETAIRIMEDSGLFDSGKGAIYNAAGFNELDAAIMDGKTLKAGSVAAVRTAKHPITLARAVMDQTPHVMLVGSGADAFLASTHGEQVGPLYYWNEAKWQALVEQLKREGKAVPARPVGAPAAPRAGVGLEAARVVAGRGKADPFASLRDDKQRSVLRDDRHGASRGDGDQAWTAAALPDPITEAARERGRTRHYGTVGVVAMDRNGNLAAGTSTGGSQGKMPGRVGDSPILGAGTYASNESCAVSATGVGEYFIRLTIARDVCALVQYEHMPLQTAADTIIHTRLKRLDGVGGLIAITPDGQAVWSYNTPGMFRARLRQGGKVEVAIFRDEP